MITGLKIGKSPSVTLSRSKGKSGRLQIGFETGGGASVGSKGETSEDHTVSQKSHVETDLIHAVRVQKLFYTKKFIVFGEKKLQHKESVDGAELAAGTDDEVNEAPPEFDVKEAPLSPEDLV